MGVAANVFGTGGSRAVELRQRLLDELGAEDEWLGTDDAGSIVWLAGPVGTSFRVNYATETVPNLAVLEVFTPCALVDDLDVGRHFVNDLNHHTTLNRWALVGDPGADGWTDGLDDAWLSAVVPPSEPGYRPPMVVGASFVVGSDDIELPFNVMEMAVREQIAKAVALVTNEFFSGWAELMLVAGSGGTVRSAPWNQVVSHYDDVVFPQRSASPAPLLRALDRALGANVEIQAERGEPQWFGSGDQGGFTCEVPYGPGPYPLGQVGMRSAIPHLSTDENLTSLVQAFALADDQQANPHLGYGLLVTMRPGGANAYELDPPWLAHLLNARSRTNSWTGSVADAHGIGAWVDHAGEPMWSMFVPAVWGQIIDPEELEAFFAEILRNCARLSWTSRVLLEPTDEWHLRPAGGRVGTGLGVVVGYHLDADRRTAVNGLTAGADARGSWWGEPGAGVNPGARLLAMSYEHLVVTDDHWARTGPGGFDYLLSERPVSLRTQRCGCDEADPGSLVSIETPVADIVDAPAVREALRVQAAHGSFTVCMEDRRLLLRSVLHVHEDTLAWQKRWPTALAVTQARYATRLDVLLGNAATPVHADVEEWGERHDRDAMLDLFAPGSEVHEHAQRCLSERALALSLIWSGVDVGAAAWIDGGCQLCWHDGFDDGAFALTEVTVRNDSEIGPSLQLRTPISADGGDPVAWCLTQNLALASSGKYGGFGLDERGVAFVSTLPGSVFVPGDEEQIATGLGTALMHHVQAVTALTEAGERRAPSVGAPSSREELANVATFYGRVVPIPDELTVTVDGDAVFVRRGFAAAATAREWPRLGVVEPGSILTRFDLADAPHVARRLVHAAMLSAVPLEFGRTSRSIFEHQALYPTMGDVDSLIEVMVRERFLDITDGGHAVLSGLPPGFSVPIEFFTTDEHAGWGTAFCCAAVLTGVGVDDVARDADWQLGDWHRGGDGEWTYRVCLPPAVFATPLVAPKMECLLTAAICVVETTRAAVGWN